MDMQPSAFPTGSAGPLGHDYWKRAVYRAAPRHFTVEMLSPTKLGGGSSYSYGIRVHPLQAVMSSGSTIRSSVPMSSSYEIWRKWEDCLWFQDTLELQYSTLSRQKRARLQSGKGVKKNGVYIQDQASSWESLPPGPDPKSVKKDVHDYLPKLTKRGTLFRTSASTIEQRNAELTALVTAFLADDVPTLIDELREDRTLRDFFGYWRRDHDLLIKSNPVRRSDPGKPRKSNVSSVAPWPILTGSMSTIDAYASVPPSPTRSTSSFAPGSNTSGPASSESSSSASSDAPPSSPTGTQMSPARTFSRSPQSEASFTTSSSRIVPNMNVVTIPPTSHEADLVSQTHSRSSAPSSRPRSHSAPQKPKSYNVSEDFPLFLSESSREPQPRPAPPGTVRARVGGLEALPEEQEQETVESSRDVENAGPSTPQVSTTPFLLRRPRAQSLAASSHRTATVCDEAFTNLEPTDDSSSAHDTPWSGHESDPDPGLSSSSATLSTLSLQSRRSSWRAGTRSRPSSSESTGSATSGIDVDLSGFLTDPSPTPSARRHSHRSKASIATVDSAEAIIPGRSSLASPTRHRRARSDPKAFPSGVEDGSVGIDSWMVLGDDFMDAYFDHQPPGSDLELDVVEEDVSQELAIPERSLDVPFTAVPSTPYDPAAHDDGSAAQIISVPETPTPDVPSTAVPPTPGTLPQLAGRRQQVAISLSPELFSQPFRASSTSGLQFHLPFTPSPNSTPELSFFPPSPAQPAFLSTPPADDAVVVKAALDDSIVSFRLPRCTPLVDARMRVADKFSHTEGLELSPGFAIAYVPPVDSRASARETLVRASTTSAATTDWSRQAWIETEEDWSVAVATCGPKLVLRVACPTPA